MPKLITSNEEIMKTFGFLEVREKNREKYHALMSANLEVLSVNGVTLSAGYQLLRVDSQQKPNHFQIALVSNSRQEVVYYNDIAINPDVSLNAKPATQVLVWRSSSPRHRTELYDIATAIFTQYLLQNYSVIVTDNHQTRDGYSFWQRRISDAIEGNFFVYAYNVMTTTLNLVPDLDAFEDLQDITWSEKDEAQFQLMIISSEELPLDKSIDLSQFE